MARLHAYNQQLIDSAKVGLARNPDGSLIEGQLRTALAKILRGKVDLDTIADQRAAAMIESQTRQPGEGEGDDPPPPMQLSLFGDSYGYNPLRLIKDSDGNIVEEDAATLPFILSELSRSSENVRRASMWNSRKAQKAVHFQKWIGEARKEGRKETDLKWGNCARETRVLRKNKP
jgi:hypothetical protein